MQNDSMKCENPLQTSEEGPSGDQQQGPFTKDPEADGQGSAPTIMPSGSTHMLSTVASVLVIVQSAVLLVLALYTVFGKDHQETWTIPMIAAAVPKVTSQMVADGTMHEVASHLTNEDMIMPVINDMVDSGTMANLLKSLAQHDLIMPIINDTISSGLLGDIIHAVLTPELVLPLWRSIAANGTVIEEIAADLLGNAAVRNTAVKPLVTDLLADPHITAGIANLLADGAIKLEVKTLMSALLSSTDTNSVRPDLKGLLSAVLADPPANGVNDVSAKADIAALMVDLLGNAAVRNDGVKPLAIDIIDDADMRDHLVGTHPGSDPAKRISATFAMLGAAVSARVCMRQDGGAGCP
jgi:hypothetical protein